MNGSLVLKECHIIISRSAHVGTLAWEKLVGGGADPYYMRGRFLFHAVHFFLINFRKKEN